MSELAFYFCDKIPGLKETPGGKTLFHFTTCSSLSWEVRAGNETETLADGCLRTWLATHGNLLFYATKYHLPRWGMVPYEMKPPMTVFNPDNTPSGLLADQS